MSEMRMEAYYYGFEKTGVPEIDKILSAVACAGKAYHHTESWCDDCYTPEGHTGASPREWIQNAAVSAASKIAALQRWKDEALEVEVSWDCQAVGEAIGIPFGGSIRKGILPFILKQEARIKELEATHDWHCGCDHWNGPNLSVCAQCGRTPLEGGRG